MRAVRKTREALEASQSSRPQPTAPSIDALLDGYTRAKQDGLGELIAWATQHLNVEIGLALHRNRWIGSDFWQAAKDDTLTSLDDLIARSEYPAGSDWEKIEDGTLFPTLYGVAEGWAGEVGIHTIRFDEYPDNTMMQVAGTGAACLLIHRTVLEKVRDAQRANGNTAYPWFQETVFNGQPCGEDVTFCHRVNSLGIPVYDDTGVSLGHQKTYTLTEPMYLAQRSQLRPPPQDVPPAAGDLP
jgi:hypothetical protein